MHEPDTTRPDGTEDEDDVFEAGNGDAGEASEPQTSQLDLGDDEVSLPWLEGDDDEEEFEQHNTGQLIGLVLAGLLVIGLIVGGIWWATGDSGNTALVAEGGVIEAPDEPYKERPEDPGGKTFEGTGDTSFAVSEGQTRPARLAKESPTPAPGFTALEKAQPAGASADKGQGAKAAEVEGVGVQVAAYSTRSSAEAGWNTLKQQYEALSGLRHRIVEGQADIGTVYRLQAVTDDAGSAKALCGQLKAAGLNCQVKN